MIIIILLVNRFLRSIAIEVVHWVKMRLKGPAIGVLFWRTK